MSWVNVYPLYYPRDDITVDSSYPRTTDIWTMDEAGVYNAICMQAPETGDVIAVGVRIDTVVEGGTYQLTLESLDGSGNPGDMLSTDAHGDLVVGDGDSDKWIETNLAGSVPVTRGQHLSVKVEHLGTDSGEISLSQMLSLGGSTFPYSSYTSSPGGTPVKSSLGTPIAALRYSETDSRYAPSPNVLPVSGTGYQTSYYRVDDTDYDDEYALKFRLPFNAKVRGFWMSIVTEGESATVKLMNASDTILATVTLTQEEMGYGFGQFGSRVVSLFQADVLLSRDTWYRLSHEIIGYQGGRDNPGIKVFDNQDVMEAMDGGGDFHLSSRQRGGTWTDDDLKRPQFSLLISEIEVT